MSLHMRSDVKFVIFGSEKVLENLYYIIFVIFVRLLSHPPPLHHRALGRVTIKGYYHGGIILYILMRNGINERQTKAFYGVGQWFSDCLRMRAKWRGWKEIEGRRGDLKL